MSRRAEDRQLSRDEVWAPTGVGPSEWVRNNSYLDYRILRNARPWGIAYVVCLGLGLFLAFTGQTDMARVVIVGDQLLFFVACGVAFVSIRRRNRARLEAQREREQQQRHRGHHD